MTNRVGDWVFEQPHRQYRLYRTHLPSPCSHHYQSIMISFHCHPIPIARMNSLYAEPEVSFIYFPSAIQSNEGSSPKSHEPEIPPVPTVPSPHIIVIRPVVISDTSSLNRCDLDEIKRYGHLLSGTSRKQLQSIRRKIELYPQRYQDPIYLRQSQMLILSPGWASASRYSCCSIRSTVNPSGACRLHRFCPYCSYLFGRQVQLSLVPAFDDANWFFLTGSFMGSLNMPDSSSAYAWPEYWGLYRDTLTHLVDIDCIRGFYLTEELAANNLLEVSVLPHIHALIDSDELKAETVVEAFATATAARKGNQGPWLKPGVEVVPVNSQRNLMSRIKYMFKPINLVKAYERDWFEHCSTDRKHARRLNSNATDVVLGYSQVNLRRNKMAAKGTLNGKCKQYIGKRKQEAQRYSTLLANLQKESADTYIELPDLEISATEINLN